MKVVCCGLPKTGTKTMVKALDVLGYRAMHSPKITRNIFRKFKKYNIEAIAGTIAVHQWKMLYDKYPKAKFILVTKSTWATRLLEKFKKKSNFYGCISRDINVLQKFYEDHNNEIREFFKDKKDQFLEMSVVDGDGWDKLCNFLGVKKPKIKFPHVKVPRVCKRTKEHPNMFLPRNMEWKK